MYAEEDFLPLSGLQHFAFCRRQWALIHIENQWAENLRTVEGDLFHQRAHDEHQRERRGDTLILRGLPVFSPEKSGVFCRDRTILFLYFYALLMSPPLRGAWIEMAP